MTAVLKALAAAKVEGKDIQTSDISVEPQYADDNGSGKPPRIISYQVNNTVSVIIRDIKNLGDVMDALIAQGANQLTGPNFSVENKDDALNKARAAAAEKAQKRAAIYAAAGMRHENKTPYLHFEQPCCGLPRPRFPMMGAMAMNAVQPVTPRRCPARSPPTSPSMLNTN